MKHCIEIAQNNAVYIDNKRVCGEKPCGAFYVTKSISINDVELADIAERCLELLKGADDE